MVASEQDLYQTMVQFDKTIVFPRKLATGSIHDYLFCYCPIVGILFEVLRINEVQFASRSRSPMKNFIAHLNPSNICAKQEDNFPALAIVIQASMLSLPCARFYLKIFK